MKLSRQIPFLLVATILAAILTLSSGSHAKDDWLPIDPADLALKDNPLSPGAHAMILYRENSIDARLSSELEYDRIKIFTEEGKKWGDVEIPFNKSQRGHQGHPRSNHSPRRKRRRFSRQSL